MKELFNTLSNVSQFFSGDRFVYYSGNSQSHSETFEPSPRVSTGVKPKPAVAKPAVKKADEAVDTAKKKGGKAAEEAKVRGAQKALSNEEKLVKQYDPRKKRTTFLLNPNHIRSFYQYTYKTPLNFTKAALKHVQLKDLFSDQEHITVIRIDRKGKRPIFAKRDNQGDYINVFTTKKVIVANGDKILIPKTNKIIKSLSAQLDKHIQQKTEALKPKSKYATKKAGDKHYTITLSGRDRKTKRLKDIPIFNTKFVKVRINKENKYHKDKSGDKFYYAYKDPSRKNDYYFLEDGKRVKIDNGDYVIPTNEIAEPFKEKYLAMSKLVAKKRAERSKRVAQREKERQRVSNKLNPDEKLAFAMYRNNNEVIMRIKNYAEIVKDITGSQPNFKNKATWTSIVKFLKTSSVPYVKAYNKANPGSNLKIHSIIKAQEDLKKELTPDVAEYSNKEKRRIADIVAQLKYEDVNNKQARNVAISILRLYPDDSLVSQNIQNMIGRAVDQFAPANIKNREAELKEEGASRRVLKLYRALYKYPDTLKMYMEEESGVHLNIHTSLTDWDKALRVYIKHKPEQLQLIANKGQRLDEKEAATLKHIKLVGNGVKHSPDNGIFHEFTEPAEGRVWVEPKNRENFATKPGTKGNRSIREDIYKYNAFGTRTDVLRK